MFIINRFNHSVFRLTSIWMTKTTRKFPFPSEALYQKTEIPIPSQVFLEGDRWWREQTRHRNAGLEQPPRGSSSPLFQHHSGGDLAQVGQDVEADVFLRGIKEVKRAPVYLQLCEHGWYRGGPFDCLHCGGLRCCSSRIPRGCGHLGRAPSMRSTTTEKEIHTLDLGAGKMDGNCLWFLCM